MLTSDPDCPFCEIIEGDDPHVREVYRDEDIVAFLPPEPATLGHTIVVPRVHMSDVWSLDELTATQLSQATLRLSRAIRSAVKPQGLNIIQSNGVVATQTVFHLHVHLVPRWADDLVGPIWPQETHYSEAQKDEAWERLRAACHMEPNP